MANVKVLTLTCRKCGHEWTPRQSDVRICPKCKTAKWDVLRQKGATPLVPSCVSALLSNGKDPAGAE